MKVRVEKKNVSKKNSLVKIIYIYCLRLDEKMQPIPTGALVGAGSLDLLKKYSLSHGQNGQLREWFGVQKIQTPILHKSKQGRLKNT